MKNFTEYIYLDRIKSPGTLERYNRSLEIFEDYIFTQFAAMEVIWMHLQNNECSRAHVRSNSKVNVVNAMTVGSMHASPGQYQML